MFCFGSKGTTENTERTEPNQERRSKPAGAMRRTKARWRRRQWQHQQGVLDEARLADCLRAVLAHLDHGNTFALRRAWFAEDTAADRFPRQPRQPRRQLQQPRHERARGQPRQQRTVDPQQQPGPAPLQDVSLPDCAHRLAACAHRAP
ncbi:MAG: hypothetical protein ACK6DH_06750 [Planctomycetota bacterium]